MTVTEHSSVVALVDTKWARLGDVADINPKWNPLAAKEDSVSFVGMAQMSDVLGCVTDEEQRRVQEVRTGYTAFERGDLLVAKITPCFENGKIGQANITNKWGAGSTEFHVVRPGDRLDAGYALHFLRRQQFRTSGKLRMTGSGGQQRVPASYVADTKIPLPPLPEQRRIAAVLNKADYLRTQRREAIAQLDALTQSIFYNMFGNPVSNNMTWEMAAFETVAPSRLGKMLDMKNQTGLRSFDYVRNANVQWFDVQLDDLLQMDFSDRERIEFGLETGDVLICEGGEPGRAAIWRGSRENCFFQKALHRARPRPDKIMSEYLVQLLWHLSHGGGLADHVTSATIAHLTGEKLKRLQIPVPPLELQQIFARRVAGVESLKERHRAQAAELDTLFASLQHRAFRGEL